ncbi:MAG TPA: T9SS type A sorting domain-containing protein, partial [Chitinophagaceae bacterium]
DFAQLAYASQSAAVKEMFVTKAEYSNGPLNWNPTLTTLDNIRNVFASRLVQKGYPQNLTRHAVSFGRGNNITGTKQAGNGAQWGNFVPGSEIFDGNVTYILANFTASAFAVPENGNSTYICRYRYFGYKVVKLFNVVFGGITIPTLRVRNFKYTSQYPYDDAPGGYETTQSQFVDRFNPINGLAGHASNEGHHGHDLIPMVSALDLKNQGYSSSNAWQSNNLYYNVDNNILNPGQVAGNTISSTLSPFNDVMTYTSDCSVVSCQGFSDQDADGDGLLDAEGANWNLYHNGGISNQASNFIQRKILNAVPGTTCPGICSVNYSIGGPTTLCSSANAIFQVTGPTTNGLNILWESEGGKFQVVAGQGTPQMTAKLLATGADFVRATLTNTCGSQRIIRYSIRLGGFGSSDYPISGPSSGCKNQNFSFSTVTLPGATNYQWTWSSNMTFQSGQGTPNLSLRSGTSTGNAQITVRVANACDAGGSPAIKFFTINNCGFAIDVDPNPSSTTINISVSSANETPLNADASTSLANRIYQIKIVDQSGNIKVLNDYSAGVSNVTINIANLISGVYTVLAFNGVEYSSKQVVKQ